MRVGLSSAVLDRESLHWLGGRQRSEASPRPVLRVDPGGRECDRVFAPFLMHQLPDLEAWRSRIREGFQRQ